MKFKEIFEGNNSAYGQLILSGSKNERILSFWYGFKNEIINGSEIKKVINEYIKYLIFTPPNHNIISPLNAMSIEVPRSGWETTKIVGINIIDKTIVILLKELTFSIFNLW